MDKRRVKIMCQTRFLSFHDVESNYRRSVFCLYRIYSNNSPARLFEWSRVDAEIQDYMSNCLRRTLIQIVFLNVLLNILFVFTHGILYYSI